MLHTVLVALAAFALALGAPPSPGTGTLVLINDSDFTVTHVYVSVCETDSWEGDLLGTHGILEPDYEVEITVDPGCWDLMAVVENDVELDTYLVDIEAGDVIEWTITSR
ncbi:hypothetical protein [Rubrivirga sp. IMCC45206]|uniref:hypothetical protein n=1 Tax=Rubrivirga sp. IMCC45206 TaxID=3391614 RepID=UPI00398FA1C6